jgi:hypothetical protein
MMSYVRQTIDSERLSGIIDLPASLSHQMVEVLVLPLGTNHFDESRKSAFGCLAKYANPDLIGKERDVWQKAVRNKHDASC